MPVTFHLATIDVFDDGDGSLVVYGAEIEPGDGVQTAAAFGAALEGLRYHLDRV